MKKYISVLILLTLSLASISLHAQEEKYIGLFVYNFTKFFDWPESMKNNTFTIQVLGHKSVYDELVKTTAGKKIGTQSIQVESINSPDQINPQAHMVFVGHWQSRHLPVILPKLESKPTLIITEMEGMLDKGSLINFIIRDGTIKFELSAANVASHQLKIDARIRELAYRVVD